MDKIGYLLLMIGCAGMDSSNRTVPAIMVLSGLVIIGITAIKENGRENASEIRL